LSEIPRCAAVWNGRTKTEHQRTASAEVSGDFGRFSPSEGLLTCLRQRKRACFSVVHGDGNFRHQRYGRGINQGLDRAGSNTSLPPTWRIVTRPKNLNRIRTRSQPHPYVFDVLQLVEPKLASGLGKDPECNPAPEYHDGKLLSWQRLAAPETAQPSNPYFLFVSHPSWIIKQHNDSTVRGRFGDRHRYKLASRRYRERWSGSICGPGTGGLAAKSAAGMDRRRYSRSAVQRVPRIC